jgi:hypothetical protein
MPTYTRESILSELETILGTISEINTVEINRIDALDQDEDVYPLAIVFSGQESRNEEISDLDNGAYEFEVEVQIITGRALTTIEQLRGLIKTAVLSEANRTLVGYSDMTFYEGSDSTDLRLQVPTGKIGMRIYFSTTYTESEG